MKLICDLLEIGIQIKIKNEQAKFKEIWLAETSRIAWDLWTRLGWFGDHNRCITLRDWMSFKAEDDKSVIMDAICRLNRIARENRENLLNQFDQGWLLVLEVASEIQRGEFWFEKSPQVEMFRKTVAFFIAYGIKRGIESPIPSIHEQFIFPAHRILHDSPIRVLSNLDVRMESGLVDTVITISDPSAFTVACHSHTVLAISV